MCVSLMLAALTGLLVLLADEQLEETQARIAAVRAYYAKAAARFEFKLDGADEEPLTFVKTPVFRWANEPGPWTGDLFIWTRQGRPEVIGCLYSPPPQANRRSIRQEFHLLSETPLAPVLMPSGARWEPKNGLKLQPIENFETPADKPILRLAQMRKAVRDFSGHMTDLDDSLMNLRSLPQPLIRYQPDGGPVVDGALFTFVSMAGTDPELILLVECRKSGDVLRWYYAPVRFTNREVWLKHRGVEVWRDGMHNLEGGSLSTSIYMLRNLETIPDPEPDES
jgi:hypothetical protein